MSESAKSSPGGGPVVIGDVTFVISELSAESENQFYRFLEGLARAATNPYTLAKPALDAANPADRLAMLQTIALSASKGEAEPGTRVINRQRESPKGVAYELWIRTRTAHPSVKLEEIEAIVTDANCLIVSDAIVDVLRGPDQSKSGPA